MNNSKDRRIKKLKKKRIWPSIVGLILISICSLALMVAVVAFLVGDIFKNKVFSAVENLEEVAGLFETVETPEDLDKIKDSLAFYVEMETYVESIAVVGEDAVPIWSYDNRYPSVDVMNEVTVIDGEDNELRVIIEDAPDNAFIIKGDNIEINEKYFFQLNWSDVFKMDTIKVSDSKALAQLKVWVEAPAKVGTVYVLNNVKLLPYDLLAVIICIILLAVIVTIFVIYYLVSTISLIVAMRKTTRVLYTDVLTGGYNWLYFEKKGNSLLKKRSASENRYAIIHLKLRKYRSYCTCFGVKEGEVLIEKCYASLKKQLRRGELLVHRENAEFDLLLKGVDKNTAVTRIEAMEAALNAVSPNIKLYYGVGVYLTQKGDRDIEQLCNNAMLACDMLGEESENKIAFFDVELNNQRIWERKVEDDLDRALTNKEFQVYLQAKIQTKKETLAGAEALVRWIHPEDGFIPPNKFIPILEKNGFITKLDDYMLEEVAALQAKWIAQGRKIVPISVNVSRAHFTRSDLAEHIAAIVDKYHVPHDVIELELTESAFFDDKKLLLDTVKKLRDSGFCVSMDDFGAGYSSLNSLKEMHIDVLKIDADFFRGVDEQERGQLIVSEVIDLAKKLDMKIVAEGIESREQVDFLTEQECDLIQGYFFAKPMPAEEFAQKYREE